MFVDIVLKDFVLKPIQNDLRLLGEFFFASSINFAMSYLCFVKRNSQLWEIFAGSQTIKEFITANPRRSVLFSVHSYVEESEFFKDLNEEEVDWVKAGLFNYIVEHAEEWAEKEEKYFSCSFKDVLESKLPLNSIFDDSIEDEDLRVLKTIYLGINGKMILEKYDLQCYNMRIGDKKPHWESIVNYSPYDKPHRGLYIYVSIPSEDLNSSKKSSYVLV